VLGTDGKPADGVRVAFNVRYSIHILGKTGLVSGQIYQAATSLQHSPMVNTDVRGFFHLPAMAGIISILAVTDQGFADMPIEQFRKSHVIELKPWGRIEGKLLSNGKPLANELVQVQFTNSFSGRGFRFAYDDFRTSTDDEGGFVFERIPPDNFSLDWTDPITGQHQSRIVKVELGKTTSIELDSATASNLTSPGQNNSQSGVNRDSPEMRVLPGKSSASENK
jgi:hypothetical protein